ncbi:MAG: hypothetical protein M1833_002427 [Piccolia ochrophora]|nr:MAG: hypothetical protein M1833_002427 [Piccolia ochrophora]
MTVDYTAISAQPASDFSARTTHAAYPKEQRQKPMDRGASEYSQSGLHSSYPAFTDPQSEASPADQASAAQYTPAQEVRPANFSASQTPTSEYGLNPSSARSTNFPEYLTRPPYQDGTPRYHPSGNNSGSSGGMAQASSPSMPLAAGQNHSHHNTHSVKSDGDVPIDPSIAASSPTYPPPGQYSPYPPQHEMAQAYPGHPGAGNMYGRPEWGQYGQAQPHGLPPYSAHTSPSTTVSSASSAATAGARPGQQSHPLSQVYSFVPIPGAQQHKRPRRRYEEIERMYKCGWNGCEKAYGTLNHLNAHVTMQSHGAKRTPEAPVQTFPIRLALYWRSLLDDGTNRASRLAFLVPREADLQLARLATPYLLVATFGRMLTGCTEFKEIRKEWKARKKEEDNQRKADEERQRAAQQANQVDPQNPTDPAQASSANSYPPGVRPQLPPIGYQPGQAGPVPGHYAAPANGIEQMQQYGNNPLYPNYPQSPYGPGNQMYQQRHTPLQGNQEPDADAEPDPDVPATTYQQ